MAARIAQIYGFVFVWHAIRHFNSYALLGSQSFFENPRPEWLALGFLQMLVGALLLWKPKPWLLIAAAIILFLWCVAYPLIGHVGDSAFIILLSGLATVQLGGEAWIPLATASGVIGIALAGLCKLHGGQFSICNLTNLILLRYPWMDGMNLMLKKHEIIATYMSDMVVGIELASPCIWILLFFPKLWLVRSLLALLPISLLFGIGITGNLDEFPWVMLTAFLLMMGPKQTQITTPIRPIVYPLAIGLCIAFLLNLGVNLQRLYFYSDEPNSLFDRDTGLLPGNRVEETALVIVAPRWDMYAGPTAHDQMFGGESGRILKLETRVKSDQGCGLALDRWERLYWERIRRGLRDPEQQETAFMLRNKYKALEGQPCSVIVFPAPSQDAPL